jgi:hypothetical protein
VRRLVVQDSWIDGFAPASDFHHATTFVNEQFLGTHILLVHVEGEGTVRRGRVAPGAVDFFSVELPPEVADEPGDLIGQWIQIRAAGAPPDLHIAPEARGLYRSPVARIVSVERREGALRAEIDRLSGTLNVTPPEGSEEAHEFVIAPHPLIDPKMIEHVRRLEEFLEGRTEDTVGGVRGPCTYLATTNFILRARRNEADRVIPPEATKILDLWMYFGRVRGLDRLREVTDVLHAQAIVTVFLTDANFVDTARLMEVVRDWEREHLTPHGLRLRFAGDVAVSQSLIDAIVSTQVSSLVLSLLGTVAVTSLIGRSLVWGFLCALPCSLAVLINFAVMGFASIPLGVATSMFSAMTLGIGIDYAIHLTEWYRAARARGTAGDLAIREAMAVTGPAVVVDGVAIMLGFGVLMFSQVPANARLGLLVVLSVASCLVATLLLLPALLTFRPRRASIGPEGRTERSV